MKKFVFMLIAMFSVVVTSCSTFDIEPIEPKIIGTGNLQYEAKTDTWFVVIDSTQYTITRVAITKHCAHTTGHIIPVEGMLVTVFTSHSMKGLQAITGEQSVKQIEEIYHTERKSVGILLGTLGIFVFWFFLLFITATIAPASYYW